MFLQNFKIHYYNICNKHTIGHSDFTNIQLNFYSN